ncbi:MAG: hypothetical protein WC602_02575 [archaeon]
MRMKLLAVLALLFGVLWLAGLSSAEAMWAEIFFQKSSSNPEIVRIWVDGSAPEYESEDFNGTWAYEAQLLDIDDNVLFSKKFVVSYMDFDSGLDLNDQTIILGFPYYSDAAKIRITKVRENTIILVKNLPNLCNHDNKCVAPESYFSCPEDCSVGASDNICNPAKDDECDKDCAPGIDLDCKVTDAQAAPAGQEASGGSGLVEGYGASAITAIAVIAIILWAWPRKEIKETYL